MATKTKSPAKEGGGTRGGAAMTAAYESLQAYACAARKQKGSPLDDIKDVKKYQVKGMAECTNSLASALRELDVSYHSSCIRTANQIFIDFPALSKGDYKFFRGKGVIHDQIYATFNKLKKDSGIANANKWNPADIWIIKNNTTLKTDFKTLQQFNDHLLLLYNKNQVIGVSLKKLAKSGGAVGIPFNTGQSLAATFSGFKVGDNITASKDVYLEFNAAGKSGSVQLRIFSSRPDPGSWQGEIGGKTAAGGKVGGGKLIEAASSSGVLDTDSLRPQNFISSINNPTPKNIKDFIDNWKKVKGIKTLTPKQEKELTQEIQNAIKTDKTWWLSKYVSLRYSAVILQSGKVNDVTNWIYRYGSSAVDNSSVFIKYGPA